MIFDVHLKNIKIYLGGLSGYMGNHYTVSISRYWFIGEQSQV